MEELRIVFMGTPEFGLPTLKALNENYNVVGVVCQPDRPSNRGEVKFSKIKQYALENNINLFQPEALTDEYADILSLNPNMVITCAYGQFLPGDFLKYPKYGCINIHASLLPKLRGGAPIQRAIMEGHKETGVTIMKTIPKMDAGDIILQERIPILDEDNAGTIHDKLSALGKELILKAIPQIVNGTATYTKQNESEATFGFTIKREDEKVDFHQTTREIINKVRSLTPWPGAYAILGGKIVKIWNTKYGENYQSHSVPGQVVKLYEDGIGVKTENGEVIITELQLEGRKRMSANQFLNGVVNKDVLIGKILE